MAQNIGMRSTAQVIAEARGVRDVADKIWFLEPDKAPLITFLTALKKSKPTYQTKFEWHDDDYNARWAQVDSTTVTTTGTSIGVVDGSLFAVGDLWAVPNAVDSSTAPEILRVTAISTNTLTVTRNIGGAGAATIGAGASLTYAGNAFAEGASFPSMRSTSPVASSSYTQIFRTPLEITNTNMAVRTYGQSDLKLLQFKKAAEHKIAINRAFLFGRASEDTSGSTPLRTTDGLFKKISTNVYNGNGTLTPQTMENFSRMAFRYGKEKKILLASPMFISAFNSFHKAHLTATAGEKTYGVRTTTIVTGHGEWLLVRDWMLEDGVSGKNGFAGNAFSLDLDSIMMRYLADNGISRNTKYLTDSIQDGADRRADEYLTECGLQINNEKHHARIYNVTGYSA